MQEIGSRKNGPAEAGPKCVRSCGRKGSVFRRQFGARWLVPSQQTLAIKVLPQSNNHSPAIRLTAEQFQSWLRMANPLSGADASEKLSRRCARAGQPSVFAC